MVVSIQVLAYSKPQIDPPAEFKQGTRTSDRLRGQPHEETVTGVTYPGLAITHKSVEGISVESLLEKMARAFDPTANVTAFGDGEYWKRFEIEVGKDIYDNVNIQILILEQAHTVLAPYVTPYP